MADGNSRLKEMWKAHRNKVCQIITMLFYTYSFNIQHLLNKTRSSNLQKLMNAKEN